MIDYNQIIDRNSISMTEYEAKFKAADDWLNSSERDEFTYGKLLMDPTTFSYLHFRINEHPLKLYPYQDMILNDKYKRKIFRAARQIGKSMALDVKAGFNLLADHGHAHNECIISISLDQAKFQMNRVKDLLIKMKEINFNEVKGKFDSIHIASVDVMDEDGKPKYTNMLVVTPCTEGSLGYDFHEVNLDEFEYWTDLDIRHFYHAIIEPTTYATDGAINIYSNPNGQDSFVAELEELILNGNKIWHTYVFNYLDKPGNTQEKLNIYKVGKTRQETESQLMAIRSISDRNYFTSEEIEKSYSPTVTLRNDVQIFMFLDVGAKHDQSVLSIGYIDFPDGEDALPHLYVPIIQVYPVGYPLSRVVGASNPEQDSDGWHYEKSVKDYYKEFEAENIVPVMGVDVTGNSGIVPLMESSGLYPEDVTFSGPQKSGFYQRFKYFMEKGLIHRCESREFEYQCAHLIMQKTQRGYLQIHHENENDLDDCCDSVAGLIHLADPRDVALASPSVKIFFDEEEKKDG